MIAGAALNPLSTNGDGWRRNVFVKVSDCWRDFRGHDDAVFRIEIALYRTGISRLLHWRWRRGWR